MPQPPLFEPPQIYTAIVPLDDIELPPIVGARRTTGRSIATFGFVTLPIVQEAYPPEDVPVDAPYRYRVVDGARRLADFALQRPRPMSVEVKVVPHAVSAESVAALAVSLNYNRAPNPIAEAEHFEDLLRFGHTPKTIAKALGISAAKISRRLALVQNLHPDLLDLVRSGGMAVSVAERAARLSEDRQAQLYAVAATRKAAYDEPPRLTAADVSNVQRVRRETALPIFEEVDPKVALRAAVAQAAQAARAAGVADDELIAALGVSDAR
jgi:ParB-like chromosome segregation protein Spo0J